MAFRRIILTVLLPVVLACSCTVSTFDKPLHKEKRLYRFPKSLRGSWKATSVSADFPVTELRITKDSLYVAFAASADHPTGISLKNDSLQVSGKKNSFIVNLSSQYGWLIYKATRTEDNLDVSGFGSRTMQIVKYYDIKEHANKMTVISYKPVNEEWDQALQYGLTPIAAFIRLK